MCLWTCFYLTSYTSYSNHQCERRKASLLCYVRNICLGERANRCGQLLQTTPYAASSHPTGQALLLMSLLTPAAGEISSLEAKSSVPSGCTPGRAVAMGSPFPYRNRSDQAGGQIQHGDETTGAKRR